MSKYRLILQGSNDTKEVMIYDPMTSEMYWEETGEPPSLEYLGPEVQYKVTKSSQWKPFKVTNPHDESLHGTKSKKPTTLKITMGLKCNYKCTYCNQAHQPHDPVGGPEDAEELVQKIKKNFDIGTYDKPRIEFWGGEPFVYWKTLKPLSEKLRKIYPNAQFTIVTNGSMLDKEKVDWLNQMGFSVGMSHDGPLHAQNRGPDPLDDPKMRFGIAYALKTMGQMRFSFNCVLTRENVSINAVRDFILEKINLRNPNYPDQPEISQQEIHVTTEELLLPYDDDGMKHSLQTIDEKKEILHNLFWETIHQDNAFSWTVHSKIKNFLDSIINKRPAEALGQKCGMDRDDNIAIDMKGNVTTCQNTSSLTKHHIGNIEEFDKISLDTSYHWTTRSQCPTCPVVQLCQGACLFLEDEYWDAACENLFWYNMAMLASSMFILTNGLVLVEVQGERIRYDGETSVKVIDIDFVKSSGKQRSWKVRKPINIPVVTVPVTPQ